MMSQRWRTGPLLLGLSPTLFCYAVVSAQDTVWNWEDDRNFGNAVASGFDVDDDLVSDYLIGDDFDAQVRLYSGRTGEILYDLSSTVGFGRCVGAMTDLNGDSRVEFLVGNPEVDAGDGGAYVYSGRDASLVLELSGNSGEHLGCSVHDAGDLDRDGLGDVMVGAIEWREGNRRHGRVLVFSGFDGAVIREFRGDDDGLFLGRSLSGGGDITGDGVSDLAMGSVGKAYVYSGADSSLVHLWQDDPATDFGQIEIVGDMNADSVPDIAVGARLSHGGEGSVTVYSGADGSLLFRIEGDEAGAELGASVAAMADANEDGFPDIIAGGRNGWLLSGRTQRALYSFRRWGVSVSGTGTNSRLVIGGHGSATVYSTDDLYLTISPEFPTEGDNLVLTTQEGRAGELCALFAFEVNGFPIHFLMDIGTLDARGARTFSQAVPPGLTGLRLLVKSFAIGFGGSSIDTRFESIEIY